MDDVERNSNAHESETKRPGRPARVLTWNINGLRKVAADHGGLQALLDQFDADVVEHDLAQAEGYHCFFTHCKVRRMPSYAGIATFVRSQSGLRTLASTTCLADAGFFGSPGKFAEGLSPERLGAIDSEGRVLVTDHGHFILFNVYAPCISSGDEDEKTEERRTFKRDFLATLEARVFEVQERGRGVVLVGDLNACASQLDHGFTMTDADFFASNWSKWIRKMLGLDSSHLSRLVDCFRRVHPNRKDAFTCWNTQTGARENNYGTRIDYIIASAAFASGALRQCDIMPEFMGSDHCPVRAIFTVPSATDSHIHPLYGKEGGGDSPAGNAGCTGREWPVHPPECSCFYKELTAKQEKLAKYFVATDSRATLPVNERCIDVPDAQDDVAEGDGTKQTPSPTAFRVEPGRRENSSTGAQIHSGKMERRQTVNTTKTSAKRRRGGSPSRQSKLTFGTAMSIRSSRNTTSVEIANSCAEITRLENSSPGGLNADDERGQSAGVTESTSAHSSTSVEECMQHEGHRQVIGSAPVQTTASSIGRKDSCSSDAGEMKVTSCRSPSDGSAQAWKAIFGQKKAMPPCDHGEASIERTVLKPGANYNRRFYTCARSAGNWPTDRNARCNFFQWRLDGVRGYKVRPPRDEKGKKEGRR